MPNALQRMPPTHDRRLLFALLLLLAASFASAQSDLPAPRMLVVLDPAHGGADNGAQLDGVQLEKAQTLQLAQRLRSLLAARGFDVLMTRENDAALSATDRAALVNRRHPAVTLTLHATASGSGVHLFASSLTPRPASEARFIAWKTVQANSINKSLALTSALNSALGHANINVTLARTALVELDTLNCPAVAIEFAPDRSNGQTVALDNPTYQAHLAESIAAALVVFRTEANQP